MRSKHYEFLAVWRPQHHAGMSDFVFSVGIRGVGAILALALNVLLARLLGVAEYGRYMTWLSSGIVLGAVAVRGVDQLLTRELAGGASTQLHQRNMLARWVTGRVGLSVALAAVLYFVWIVVIQPGFSYHGHYWLAAFAGVGVVGLFAFCTIEAGAINGFSASLRSQSLTLVVRNGGVLVLLGLLYGLFSAPQDATGALWLQVGGFAIAALIGAYWLHALSRRTPGNGTAGRAMPGGVKITRGWNVASRHFLLVTIASVLVNRLDVVLVSSLSDAQVAGVYAAGARLAQVALMVALAVNVVLSPRIAHAHRQGDVKAIRSLFRSGLLFTLPIAVIEVLVATILGPRIVSVFGASYAAAAAPFAWVTVAYALWALAAPGYALLAMTGSERAVASLSWIVLIANVGTIIALVPDYGAAGAGIAMIAGYGLALMALLGILAKRRDKIMFGKIG